jgi:DNA polymerase III subunit delta
MHATEFLRAPAPATLPPVIVLFGDEPYLQQEVLHRLCAALAGDSGEEASLTLYSGTDESLELKTVLDELRTVSMWGGSRVVIVEDADDFVTRFRGQLEKYVAAPARGGTLILLVRKWPKNTRLAKAVAKSHLDVECGALKKAELAQWACEAARDEGKQLPRPAAAVLIELAGESIGQLTQEIAKLAAYVGNRDRITEDDIHAVVGGWSVQTTFKMMDALVGGRLDKALELLDKLISAGEAPQRILGGISFCLRRLVTAAENARHGTPLKSALAKVLRFPNEIDASERYLRRLGRPRVEQFLSNLLATDGGIKGLDGGSRVSERIVLEQLLVRLSGRLPVEMS